MLTSGPEKALVIRRYNNNATVDTTFGSGGNGIVNFVKSGCDYDLNNMAIQTVSGVSYIVAAGSLTCGGSENMFVFRVNMNGTADTTFGSGGLVDRFRWASGVSSAANSIVIQPADGKIVLGGYTDDGTLMSPVMVRLGLDNNADAGFGGNNGAVTRQIGGADGECSSIAIDPIIGRLICAGYEVMGTDHVPIVFAYTSDGKIDTNFGGTGLFTLTEDGAAENIFVDPATGKGYIAGWVYEGTNPTNIEIITY